VIDTPEVGEPIPSPLTLPNDTLNTPVEFSATAPVTVAPPLAVAMSIWRALCAVAEMVRLEVLGLVTEGPWA
jgi:hypothetical protein